MEHSEETELASFIEHCASIGYGKYCKTAAEKGGYQLWLVVTLHGKTGQAALRKDDSTAFVRMDTVNEETLNGHFDLIEDTLIYKIHHLTSTKLESHWTQKLQK